MEFDNEEEEEPSIEDIKQVVNSKRNNTSKKYSKEDRLKNLELAREKRKNMNLMKKVSPAPIPASIPAPIVAPIVAPIPAPIPENDLINELKNMFLRQNEILEKIKIEPKTRVKKEPKKKQT